MSLSEEKQFELSWVLDFLRASDMQFDQLLATERPDFIAIFGDQRVGIELTIATQKLENSTKFAPLQISQAQNNFDLALRDKVGDAANVIIMISHNTDVPVGKEDWNLLDGLSAFLQSEASKLPSDHVRARRFYNSDDSIFDKSKPDPENMMKLPRYMQSIGIYRDGQKGTLVAGGGGGISPPFDDDILESILVKKEKKLENYQACNERWLVILSDLVSFRGQAPSEKGRSFPTSAALTNFGKVECSKSIESEFNRIFLFKWPIEVHELT